jgi:hypothetical protein
MAVGPAAQSETPVDLGAYTAWRQQDQRVAAAAGAGRVAISRRPMIDLPVQPPLDSTADGASSPGPEFEPLDVPAFLRRQTEA